MAAYPTPGGFLVDQGELDFNLEGDDLFLAVAYEWGAKIRSKFLRAPDAKTAMRLIEGQVWSATNNVSVAIISWEQLRERKIAFDRGESELN